MRVLLRPPEVALDAQPPLDGVADPGLEPQGRQGQVGDRQRLGAPPGNAALPVEAIAGERHPKAGGELLVLQRAAEAERGDVRPLVRGAQRNAVETLVDARAPRRAGLGGHRPGVDEAGDAERPGHGRGGRRQVREAARRVRHVNLAAVVRDQGAPEAVARADRDPRRYLLVDGSSQRVRVSAVQVLRIQGVVLEAYQFVAVPGADARMAGGEHLHLGARVVQP